MEQTYVFTVDGDEAKTATLRFAACPHIEVGDTIKFEDGTKAKIKDCCLNVSSGKHECCCEVVKEPKPATAAKKTAAAPKKRRVKAK